MSRARNRSAEEDPAALPDLSPGMQLSDIRKLPLSFLRHYTETYNLPRDGTKQSLSQRLYDYLQAENSSSPGDSDPSEGEHTPSRSSTLHRRHSQRHTVSMESGSSTEGEHTPSQTNHHLHVKYSHRRHNSHLRPSLQSKDNSSLTEGECTPSEESHSHHRRKKCRRYHRQRKHRSRHRSSSFSSSTSQSSTDDSSYSSSSTTSPERKRRRQRVSSSSLQVPVHTPDTTAGEVQTQSGTPATRVTLHSAITTAISDHDPQSPSPPDMATRTPIFQFHARHRPPSYEVNLLIYPPYYQST